MKELRLKIQELVALSRETANGWEEMEAKIAKQDALIEELEQMAREKNTLVGRILKFPMADSYALYVITAELIANVHAMWLDYCDGWKDARLGDGGNVNINYARSCAKFDDYLYQLKQDKLKEPEPEPNPEHTDLFKSMF